jgi:hypothetical protein
LFFGGIEIGRERDFVFMGRDQKRERERERGMGVERETVKETNERNTKTKIRFYSLINVFFTLSLFSLFL